MSRRMHIQIEAGVNQFKVNGVVLEKQHIMAMFPDTTDEEKALLKYLSVVPYLADQGVHLLFHHKLSECAGYGVMMAPKLVTAIGITDENTIPFMVFCFKQAGDITPTEMVAYCRDNFGECNEDHGQKRDDSNVIQFRPRDHTVH